MASDFNLAISLLKKVIPSQVRLPCFIVIISGFVTLVGMLLQRYVPSLYDALGLFLSLITVNCIILGRAEMFACKNKVIPSIFDGLGMGLGFTMSLLVVGSFREILGSGTWFGLQVMPDFIQPMTLFILPAGGFFSLGIIIAIVGKISKKKPKDITCSGCPNRDACRFAEAEAKAEQTETAKEVK